MMCAAMRQIPKRASALPSASTALSCSVFVTFFSPDNRSQRSAGAATAMMPARIATVANTRTFWPPRCRTSVTSPRKASAIKPARDCVITMMNANVAAADSARKRVRLCSSTSPIPSASESGSSMNAARSLGFRQAPFHPYRPNVPIWKMKFMSVPRTGYSTWSSNTNAHRKRNWRQPWTAFTIAKKISQIFPHAITLSTTASL